MVILCCAATGIGAGYWYANQLDQEEKKKIEEQTISQAQKMLNQLYQDEEKTKPRLDITKKELDALQTCIEKMNDLKEKKQLEKQFQKIKSFYNLQQRLNHFFEGDVIKKEITKTDLLDYQKQLEKRSQVEQSLLKDKLMQGIEQLTQTETAISKLRGLFQDDELSQVRENVNRQEYEDVYQFMKNLKQTWVLSNCEEKFQLVNEYVKKKEEEAKRKAAEERERQRQLALAEQRRKEEEQRKIEEAYVEITGIEFINQRTNQVLNGCEAASLLMSLHYRGYATTHNLVSFANEMPKHDTDPHQGFIHSIFDLEPKNVTRWIAPDALARFGSNYATTTNISGSSPEQLKEYINQRKPVVVYTTSNFNYPSTWDGEVPLNLHVVLLTGYNRITGNYIVLDPWSGRKIISKQKFESIYNLIRYAVVVQS